MPSVNKTSMREELDSLKSQFNDLLAGGKLSTESQALFRALLGLIEIMFAVFMEKTTRKTNDNSSIPSSQTGEDETTPPKPGQRRSIQRLAAERQWLASGLPVEIFRLAGIYGPGRSAFDKLRSGSARRIVKPGHLFSRIHVQDIATVLMASITRPDPGAIYNVCDDEPSEQGTVLIEAARLLGIDPPPPIPFAEADLSPMAASFDAESRLVRNDRMKQALGVTLSYPSYREGLRAILESENRKA